MLAARKVGGISARLRSIAAGVSPAVELVPAAVHVAEQRCARDTGVRSSAAACGRRDAEGRARGILRGEGKAHEFPGLLATVWDVRMSARDTFQGSGVMYCF